MEEGVLPPSPAPVWGVWNGWGDWGDEGGLGEERNRLRGHKREELLLDVKEEAEGVPIAEEEFKIVEGE